MSIGVVLGLRDSSSSGHALSLQMSMLWNSVGSFAYLLCTWAITVLVVVLSTNLSDSGILATAMAVGNIVATIVLFHVRPLQVASSIAHVETSDYVGMRFSSSFVAIVFAFLYSLATVESSALFPVALYSLFKIVESFADVYYGVEQRFNRLDLVGISQLIKGPCVLFSFAACMTLTKQLAFGILGMTVSSALVCLLFDMPNARKYDDVRPRFAVRTIVRLFKACLPGLLASLFTTAVVSLSRQVFGLRFGNEALGLYAAVSTPTAVIQALATYIYSPLFGLIGDSYRNGEGRKIISTLRRFCLVLIALVAISVVLSLMFGKFALGLVYGAEVAAAWRILPGVLVCTGITAALNFYIDVLVIIRNVRGSIAVGLASLITCLLLIVTVLNADMNSISFCIGLSFGVGMLIATALIRMQLKHE